ncbi:MAG TPA: hypothetical protein VMR98_05795, partial [Candidatus Polarisedimenticolaceae bacterium]|nr:hypothetical protein [Candidatus Polarisedimenticolaceae bacterium]
QYSANLSKGTYVVTVAEYPPSVDVSDPTKTLNDAVTGVLSTVPGGKERVRKPGTTDGSPSIVLEANGDNSFLMYKAVLKGHTIYSALAGNDELQPAIQGQKFLDSFTIK